MIHLTHVNMSHLNPARLVGDFPAVERWRAESTWVVGYVPRWFTCPQTVSHPSSNRARDQCINHCSKLPCGYHCIL